MPQRELGSAAATAPPAQESEQTRRHHRNRRHRILRRLKQQQPQLPFVTPGIARGGGVAGRFAAASAAVDVAVVSGASAGSAVVEGCNIP